jgi:sterol 3beta-glucosyltransferase
MRIGLQSWGTEGDLRPFLALAQALKRHGHEVQLAFTGVEGKDFTALAASAGVETRFPDDGYFIAHREELAIKTRESLSLGSPLKQLELILKDLMDPVVDSMLDAARSLAADSDVVVGHFLAHTAAAAAEERSRPYVMLALQPVFASAHYAPAGAPSLGRLLNPITWKLAESVMSDALLGRTNATRVRCGLPASKRFRPIDLGSPRDVLLAVSPSLFPRPPDWSPRIDICGFIGLTEESNPWTPEARVEAFLGEAPPVYLSFGSMFGLDERHTLESLEVFAAAITLARARGIVQAPASLIARAPKQDNLCYIDRAPHAQLFPRCSAIVHHGGAGTTQSALLAGRGSVIVPHAADQFYWGDLLHARGVAARPLKRPALAAGPLATRIRAVLDDPSISTRAGELAATLRGESGAERAATRIAGAGERPRT